MEATLRSTQLIRAGQRDVLGRLEGFERAIDAQDQPEAKAPIVQELGAFFRTEVWALVWKEEYGLLPVVKPFIPVQADTIARIRRDHDELRKRNDRFQDAVHVYLANPNNGRAMAAVRESSTGIRALLQDHIPAEDKAMLAVADANLDERQDQRILDVFDTVEADLAWGFENLQEFYP